MSKLSANHLLTISDLSDGDIELLFSKAEEYLTRNKKNDKKNPILKGRTQLNLFFENSTRTRTSFELAGKRLGADVINIQATSSAISKGETLIDTASTLNAMCPDYIVIRHNKSGSAKLLSQFVQCPVINAGDGSHEHPTQALLDALTIKLKKDKINGLTVAICGDILHSRVARSNIELLTRLGAKIKLIAAPTLIPVGMKNADYEIYTDMSEGLKDADIVMMLRLQMERMNGCFIPSVREYYHNYGLNYKKLESAKPDALVMHPGPINRGLEIDTKIADDIERNVILEQVEIGVAIRQAILELMG